MRALRVLRRSIVTAAAIACAFVFVPSVAVGAAAHLGRPTFAMATGSMAPWARPGDLVVDRLEPARQLTPGQVLTFRSPVAGGVWISHRVVSVADGGDLLLVRTKGDRNARADARLLHVPATARVAVATGVVPHGGRVVTWAEGPLARRLLALGVFVLVLALVWPRRPEIALASDPTAVAT